MPLNCRPAVLASVVLGVICLTRTLSAVEPAPNSADAPLRGASHADQLEQARIHAHFDSVVVKLTRSAPRNFTALQRANRQRVVALVQAYNARGVFPHNYDFRDQPTPYFIDRKTGTLCAVAHLLEQTGRRDVVDRIARANNNVRVAELAGDTALASWLDRNGLTLAEAARVQVPYMAPGVQAVQVAKSVAVPVTGVAALGVASWNMWGNRNGHSRVGNYVGVAAGVLATGFGAEAALQDDATPALRMVASAGTAIGALSVALAARSLHRRPAYLAARRSAESTRRTDVEATIAPIIPMGKSSGAGLSMSIRFY